MTECIDVGTRMLRCIHKAGGACPGSSRAGFVMAMEGIHVAGRVAGKGRRAKVARLLEVINTRVGQNTHGCTPDERIWLWLYYTLFGVRYGQTDFLKMPLMNFDNRIRECYGTI